MLIEYCGMWKVIDVIPYKFVQNNLLLVIFNNVEEDLKQFNFALKQKASQQNFTIQKRDFEVMIN